MENPVHAVEWAWRGLVMHRGADRLAAHDTVKTELGRQLLDGAARDAEALAHHLPFLAP